MVRVIGSLLLVAAMLAPACTFTRKVRTGMQAYEVRQYALAARLFETEYEAAATPAVRAQLAYHAGLSFSILDDQASAARWFHEAWKAGYGDAAYAALADALKRQSDYDGAIAIYTELTRNNPGVAGYRASLTATRQAKEWAAQPDPDVTLEPEAWNSPAADYMAVPLDKDKVLFTSDRGSREGSDTYAWTGRPYADLYLYDRGSRKVTPYEGPVNSPLNDGTGVRSPDGRWFVFTRCEAGDSYDAYCRLMIARKEGNAWSEPSPMPFQQDKANYGHPAFAANGTTLIFSSDQPGGLGGHDLWFTRPDGKDGWEEPVNLGPGINTGANEQFPATFRDTLYFASDRQTGLGGLDIFRTFFIDDRGTWASPINLGAPINSSGDDFAFVVDTFSPLPDGIRMQGYLTSSRGGPGHNDDIYRFAVAGRKPETIVPVITEETDTTTSPVVALPQLFLSIRVMEPRYEVRDDPNSRMIGKKELPNGPVIMTKGLTDERFVTDGLGQLLIRLDWNTSYGFTARYRDHLAATYEVNTAEIIPDMDKPVMTINHMFVLDPIFKDKEIVLENIFYDYDEWAIRDDAKPSLNRLSVILKNNPQVRILLSSYTDCRGTDEYNMELSRKRAEAAVEYLQSVGIPARRLEFRGLGESSPVIDCDCDSCTEAEHQANRRTTFKIID